MRSETVKIIEKLRSSFKGESLYDIGGGYEPVKQDLVGKNKITVVDYVEMPGVDIVDDMMSLGKISDNSVENIYCSDALEHVSRPWDAIKQFHRVLLPGGVVFLTVPFVWHFHGHQSNKDDWRSRVDFWRFTPHALESLCYRYFKKIECDWDAPPPLGPQNSPIWRCGVYFVGEKLERIRGDEYLVENKENKW